jgi:hypothetical protein
MSDDMAQRYRGFTGGWKTVKYLLVPLIPFRIIIASLIGTSYHPLPGV